MRHCALRTSIAGRHVAGSCAACKTCLISEFGCLFRFASQLADECAVRSSTVACFAQAHLLRLCPTSSVLSVHKRTSPCRTQIIDKYENADGNWVPDVVGRAYGNRGNARARQGNLDPALRDYNRAMEICPWSVDPLLNRGAVLEQQGRCARRPAAALAHATCQCQLPASQATCAATL